MKFKCIDKCGYPIETFQHKPFKSFFRLVCQIIRGNIGAIIFEYNDK